MAKAQQRVRLDVDADLATNPQRVARRADVIRILEAAFSALTAAEVLARLEAAGVPAGLVRSIDEVYAWEQTKSQGLIIDVQHASLGPIQLPGPPLRFFEISGDRRSKPPSSTTSHRRCWELITRTWNLDDTNLVIGWVLGIGMRLDGSISCSAAGHSSSGGVGRARRSQYIGEQFLIDRLRCSRHCRVEVPLLGGPDQRRRSLTAGWSIGWPENSRRRRDAGTPRRSGERPHRSPARPLGLCAGRPCLGEQSQGDRSGVDHADPPFLRQREDIICQAIVQQRAMCITEGDVKIALAHHPPVVAVGYPVMPIKRHMPASRSRTNSPYPSPIGPSRSTNSTSCSCKMST